MKTFITTICILISIAAAAQVLDLPFGKVSHADLDMKVYAKDTSANAVVLHEWGIAQVDDETGELVFEKYLKIKILKKEGFGEADFSIPLYKNGSKKERLIKAIGTTYNHVGNNIKETKLDAKNIFTENRSAHHDVIKFTLPDVHEGSVIEVKYKLGTPYLFNFWPWEFQSDIPKVHSEYWAMIPGNYLYNITLKGFLRLKKNESSIVQNCFTSGNGGKSECSLTKYGIDDIPAFVEEEYMTAKSNFLSAIHFELSEIKYFDGRVDKITKEWKDVDQELRNDEKFGDQIKKGRNLLEEKFQPMAKEPDTLKKAKLIYDWVKSYYTGDGTDGMFTDQGVKKAFETKKGNSAEINISLLCALQAAGVNAYPVILSTRDNGLPTQVHPVLTDFNYVVAYAEIGGKQYFLDGTNALRPFGLLPMRCINGKGRLLAKESSWIDVKGREKQKSTISINLSVTPDGYEGILSCAYQGYKALSKRSEIFSAGERAEYIKLLKNEWKEIEIVDYEVTNLDSIEKTLEEVMNIKIASQTTGTVYFNPFIVERWEKNPFTSSNRLYPVDFGVPLEEVVMLNLRYPETYAVDELPTKVALGLPDNGGRLLFNVATVGNRVTVTSNLTINKPVYTSAEYGALKELFSRLIQIQQSQIVLKKL